MFASPVKIVIIDDQSVVDDLSMKESVMSNLLTAINQAYFFNREIQFKDLDITLEFEKSVKELWKHCHFYCPDDEVVLRGEKSAGGFVFRDIPLMTDEYNNVGEKSSGYHEVTISFDNDSRLSSFYFSIENTLLMQLFSHATDVVDYRRRLSMVDYIEHCQTCYYQRNEKCLRRFFEDDALLMSGSPGEGSPLIIRRYRVERNQKKEKKDCLSRLQSSFKELDNNAIVDDVIIRQHVIDPNLCEVALHVTYRNNNQQESGVLYML